MCEWTLSWEIIFIILFLPLIGRSWLSLLLDLFHFDNGTSEEGKVPGEQEHDHGSDSSPGESGQSDESEQSELSDHEEDNLLGSTSTEPGNLPDSTWDSNNDIGGCRGSGKFAVGGERNEWDSFPFTESGFSDISKTFDAETWLGSGQPTIGQARYRSTSGGSGEQKIYLIKNGQWHW